MSDYSNEKLLAPQVSNTITFVFGGFVCVWFFEMIFLGFPSLARIHSVMWQVPIPHDPRLELVQYITWALAAPAKGAFLLMAIIGLKSKNPSTRAALFASMSLVPPLNMLFPFRQQGFLFGPMAVATTLSTITWGSFLYVREWTRKPERRGTGGSPSLTGWEKFQYVWFALNSMILTLVALFFLFDTRSTLNLVFPSLTGLFSSNEGALSSPVHSTMAAGTHVLALATASWIATVKCRSNATLRQAMTIANAVHAGLFLVFPLRQIAGDFGGNSATSSILVAFVPLFIGWLLFAAFSFRADAKKR